MDMNNENRPSSLPTGKKFWSKTSEPCVGLDKRSGKYRLSLNFTPGKGQKVERKRSRGFETRQQALAAAAEWRSNWEEGRRGRSADPQFPRTTMTSAYVQPAVPPGKLLHALDTKASSSRNHPFSPHVTVWRRNGYYVVRQRERCDLCCHVMLCVLL